jgi:hypothetical protein
MRCNSWNIILPAASARHICFLLCRGLLPGEES